MAEFAGFLCVFSAAIEHAHRHTSYDDAVVMEQGRTATKHLSVTPPRATDRPAPLPPACRVPADGKGDEEPFFRTILRRRRDIDGGTMVARLSALSTRVRISSVGPLPVLWCEIFTGSHAVISSYDFALGYPVVRAWVEHRHRRNDHYRSSCKA